jgi:hypothetical protein
LILFTAALLKRNGHEIPAKVYLNFELQLSKGRQMSTRDKLIEKYANDLKEKCFITPDMDLLTKVTIGCGPSIFSADASTVSASDKSELETVKKSFLIKKLGLTDGPNLDSALASVMETYGKSNRNKYRAVIYYMLTKHFGKEAVYK